MTNSPPSELGSPQVTFKTVFVVVSGTLFMVGLLWLLFRSASAIALTGISALLAVALDHLVQRLQRWQIKRGIAIAMAVVVAVALVAAVGLIVVPTAVTQAKALIKASPHLLNGLQESPLFNRLDEWFHIKEDLDDPGQKAAELIRRQAAPLVAIVSGFLAFISGTVVIVFLTIFMLVFGGDLLRKLVAEARPSRRALYQTMIEKIHQVVGGYVIGLMVICSANAIATTTFLAINHTSFFLPLGIFSGFSSVIPYAGPLVAGVTITGIAFGTGGTAHGVAAGIFFLIYGQIEGSVLSPLVFRRAMRVNPLLVTLAILFFAKTGGIVGAIAAVPILSILQVVVGQLLDVRRKHLEAECMLPAGNVGE